MHMLTQFFPSEKYTHFLASAKKIIKTGCSLFTESEGNIFIFVHSRPTEALPSHYLSFFFRFVAMRLFQQPIFIRGSTNTFTFFDGHKENACYDGLPHTYNNHYILREDCID